MSAPSIPSLYSNKRLNRSQSLILNESKSPDYLSVKHLTDELKRTKEKLEKPCEMCNNYEVQLQTAENNISQLRKQLSASQDELRDCKAEIAKEHKLRAELEERFVKEAKETEKQVKELERRLENSGQELTELQSLFSVFYNEANEKIAGLASLNQKMRKEIQSLTSENNALLGRHIVKSQELQQEMIDMPQELSEMQFYCLKLREDLITALTAKERSEETYRSEILFLREQNDAEQQAKESLEESLTQDNEFLRNQNETLRREHTEMKEKYLEMESMLNQCQTKIAGMIQETEHKITNLQWQTKLEEENADLKSKIQSLQIELDNSEAVQRDFVKLSQSLQIQLEKIRQADVEVRWQHEDDAKECNQCKRGLNYKKEKSHCSHCGRIFCTDCNNKVIYGGPNRRAFKVCSVCHTLLDRETAPYFSNEPPQSPS